MTPEAQRIAIAEACGKLARPPCDVVEYQRWEGQFNGVLQRVRFSDGRVSFAEIRDLPDYLTDLNAMHEAEKTMPRAKRNTYTDELCDVVKAAHSADGRRCFDFDFISATAAQRAEAFLRTVGKWDDSK